MNRTTNFLEVALSDVNQAGRPPELTSIDVRATYGVLQVTASASATATVGEGAGAFFGGYYGGGPVVLFRDSLSITSATLPFGTPVEVLLTELYEATLSPAFMISGSLYQRVDTYVNLYAFSLYGNHLLYDQINTNLPANHSFSFTLHTTVGGDSIPIQTQIYASGYASANVLQDTSVAASLTGKATTYINVLTAGAGYSAESGAIYPARPALTFQFIDHIPVLSWPLEAAGYTLQEQPMADAAAWTDCPNSVTPVGQNFQVTLSPGDTNHFFRLIHR